MPSLQILFIGGTGIISSEAVALAIRRGHSVTVLNRGQSSLRSIPAEARILTADVRDAAAVRRAVEGLHFDVVADFLSFTPEQVQQNIDIFAGKIGQYIFVSSASAYQKPVLRLPITESTPLKNPYWRYSRDKIAGEELLLSAYRETGFPVTIVRPSHTYDRTSIPINGGWTMIDRMRRGEPVIVHGDGTSLWVLTHSRDFAVAFVGLLGNPQTIGEAFQITSDFVLTWDQITNMLADAAGTTANIVHVTSDAIAAADPDSAGGHLGDRTHSVIFDNSKIRSVVPEFRPTITFAEGAREMVDWYDSDAGRRVIDPSLNVLFDRLAEAARPV